MTPLAELERATRLIAGTFQGARCVEASALAVEVGALLDLELTARPVSVFAFNAGTGMSVATGEQGRAFGEQFLRHGVVQIHGEFEGGSPFQRNAGHMIVLSAENRILLDPTFSQFEALGEAAVALYVSEIDARAKGRFWHVEGDDFFVRYFAADDFMEDGFDLVRDSVRSRAAEIVAYIRGREES